jgi:hypothetical protein
VKRRKNILWAVLISLIMSMSLTTSDWVLCKGDFPDEYMDQDVGTDQDARQNALHGVRINVGRCCCGNTALNSSDQMSRKVPSHRHQPCHCFFGLLASMCLQHLEVETGQLCINAFPFGHESVYSPNIPSSLQVVSILSNSDLGEVILRI